MLLAYKSPTCNFSHSLLSVDGVGVRYRCTESYDLQVTGQGHVVSDSHTLHSLPPLRMPR